MDLNRNQFLMLGVVVLLLGVQFRTVDTFVLTPEATRFLAEKTGRVPAPELGTGSLLQASGPLAKKSIQPPEWAGWALISIGSVMTLHSFSMRRPDMK